MTLTCRTCHQLEVPYTLELIINNRCSRMNHPCESCRVFLLRNAEMPFEIAQNAIRNAAKIVEERKLSSIGIVLTGGDLSQSFDLMKKIVSFARNEVNIQSYFLLDGLCGVPNADIMKWREENKIMLISNWNHTLILEHASKRINNLSSARLYVSENDIDSICDDVLNLQKFGFKSVEIKFLDTWQWLKNNAKVNLLTDKLKMVLDFCIKEQDFYVDIVDYSILDEPLELGKKINCDINDSRICVDLDGKHYPCIKLSPLFMLRSIAACFNEKAAKLLVTFNKTCNDCNLKGFCFDCLGDDPRVIDASETGTVDFPPSPERCYLAKLSMKTTFKYGCNLIKEYGNNSILKQNLKLFKVSSN